LVNDAAHRGYVVCRLEAHGIDSRDAGPAHLIYFHPERDLQPIILANCNYSLEVGKGSRIEYDFRTMEKQVEERFVWGRPRLHFPVSAVTDAQRLVVVKMLKFEIGVRENYCSYQMTRKSGHEDRC